MFSSLAEYRHTAHFTFFIAAAGRRFFGAVPPALTQVHLSANSPSSQQGDGREAREQKERNRDWVFFPPMGSETDLGHAAYRKVTTALNPEL